jgi:hypothetical protein
MLLKHKNLKLSKINLDQKTKTHKLLNKIVSNETTAASCSAGIGNGAINEDIIFDNKNSLNSNSELDEELDDLGGKSSLSFVSIDTTKMTHNTNNETIPFMNQSEMSITGFQNTTTNKLQNSFQKQEIPNRLLNQTSASFNQDQLMDSIEEDL